jgi:hypothetical protein
MELAAKPTLGALNRLPSLLDISLDEFPGERVDELRRQMGIRRFVIDIHDACGIRRGGS